MQGMTGRAGSTTRRWMALVLWAAAIVMLAGCSGGPAGPTPASATPSPTGSGLERVAIAYDVGGRGGGGFNDLAYEGALRAATELGAELKEITAKPSDTDADREERLALLADAGYNPVIGVGYTYAGPMAKVAARYPDTCFGIVDDGTVAAPNVVGILFTEEQGSFLVGVAAALKSRTGNVGFVGAVPVPLIQKFEAGFTAGARAVNPDIKVQVAYLSQPPDFAGFNDPAKGKEAALGMYDAGADVVFAAAGGSGVGVIGAAKDQGRWAIGVDADEYRTSDPSIRDAVLTSMLKRADAGTYAFVRNVADGTATGGSDVFDLARGGVGYATSGGFIDDITDEIDAYAAKIIAGEIVVPTTP